MILDKKNTYMEKLYNRATLAANDRCGMFATCSTCMYAAYPVDFELTGYHAYCTKERKEVKE